MRRVTAGILMLALVIVATGCGSMKVNVPEPQAGQWTFKNQNFIFWEGWDTDETTPLPAVLTLNAHKTYIARVSDIPLHEGLTVFATIETFGLTEFAEAGQVPLVISPQDVEDVARGNVVRIVVVDPKNEYQTSRFVQLRLAPTEDVMERAEEIGEPLLLAVLGNREPRYIDLWAWRRKATSY